MNTNTTGTYDSYVNYVVHSIIMNQQRSGSENECLLIAIDIELIVDQFKRHFSFSRASFFLAFF